jgi:DNA mismatch repair protein MutS
VARLAGLPPTVVARAREILTALEHDELSRGGRPSPSGAAPAPQQQLGLFERVASEADERLKERIREIDVNRTTPLDALQILVDLKKAISS